MPTAAHCHKRVAKIAKECAAATYEELMSCNDALYSAWKKKNPTIADNPKKLLQHFVNCKWGMFVEAARATLALMLREPLDEATKEEIMDILTKDASLIRGRVNPAQIAGTINPKG